MSKTYWVVPIKNGRPKKIRKLGRWDQKKRSKVVKRTMGPSWYGYNPLHRSVIKEQILVKEFQTELDYGY